MSIGIVKWYDPDKGFGFIAREDGGGDLFVHHTVVGTEILAEGDRVEFSSGVGLKGERAESIRVLERSGLPARPSRAAGAYAPSFDRRPTIDPTLPPRETGVVRRFDPDKGFGFIVPDNGGDDVFFHGSTVVGERVRSDDQVEFRLGRGQKGPRAEQVRLSNGVS